MSTKKSQSIGEQFAEMFKNARLGHYYWLETIALCDTKKKKVGLSKRIAKMEKAVQAMEEILQWYDKKEGHLISNYPCWADKKMKEWRAALKEAREL